MTASHVPIDGTYARRRACALASAILIGLTLVGCGTTYNDYEIDPGTVYDGDPLVEPLPFAIGVYYGPEFHVQEANIKRSGPSWVDRYHLRLGPSSIALFDRVLEAQFADFHHVELLPQHTAREPELDAVIEVAFQSVGLMEETVTRGLRVAMRNAAARFLVEFHSRLDVRIWLADLGFTEPLAQVSLPRPHSQLM
jgi:hypothetical protein